MGKPTVNLPHLHLMLITRVIFDCNNAKRNNMKMIVANINHFAVSYEMVKAKNKHRDEERKIEN